MSLFSSFITVFALFCGVCAADELTFELPKFSFKHFESEDELSKDPSIAVGIANSLVTLGAIQITDIPFYQEARLAALDPLSSCLEAEVDSSDDSQIASMTMADGSHRLSVGAKSSDNSRIPIKSRDCSKTIESLRFVVDTATQQFFNMLDLAAAMSTTSSSSNEDSSILMGPNYKSFKELMEQGEHLEHLHSYFPPNSIEPEAISSTSNADLSSYLTKPTIDLHSDVGLLIAMTVGHYTTYNDIDIDGSSDGSGLHIKLLNGLIAKALADDGSLIIMVGQGGAQWLSPLLGAPLRAVPHALKAALSTSNRRRSWYGKMFFPPLDAIIPAASVLTSASEPVTYRSQKETMRLMALANAKSNRVFLPSGCEQFSPVAETDPIAITSLKTNQGFQGLSHSDHSRSYDNLLTADESCEANEIYCWMRCMSCPNEDCSAGSSMQCVDKSSGDVTDPGTTCTTCEPACAADDAVDSYNTTDAFCYGSGISMFMEGFRGSLTGGEAERVECVNLLFTEWTLDERWKFYVACVGVFLVSLLVQYLTKLRVALRKNETGQKIGRNLSLRSPLLVKAMVNTGLDRDRWGRLLTFSATLLAYAAQVTLSYFLMLVAMTYSVELFTVVCVGLTTGQALFNMDLPPAHSTDPCCADFEPEDDDDDRSADLLTVHHPTNSPSKSRNPRMSMSSGGEPLIISKGSGGYKALSDQGHDPEDGEVSATTNTTSCSDSSYATNPFAYTTKQK